MITMPKVFSDNAMFLHSAHIDLRGTAEPGEKITARIVKAGAEVFCANGNANESGEFCLRISTPAPSFDEYSIVLASDDSEYVMNNVLFGELWLACGQSNMEMPNHQQPEWWTKMSKRIANKHLRAFTAPRLGHDAEYPINPVTDTDGWWINASDSEKMKNVSALATSFSSDLYDYFCDRGEQIPVGFLNCSRGGTCIETWIPHEIFEKYPKITYKKPDLENWNKKGEGNYQQPGAHYNFNTHPHLGVKARGMLWYQGESNLGQEQTQHIYKDLMIALRESYKELFAVSQDEVFPMISSQIYPWRYTDRDESNIGYLNKCFSDLGKTYPELYPFVPICDLSPIWTYHSGNHPIHPAHKYALGSRFALLCENIFYQRSVKNVQKLPPMLKSCVRHANKLRLTFENVGNGLHICGGTIKGLYIKSDKSAYVPAKCEIVNKRVLNVWNDHIDAPKHVAYAVSSYETATNLYAGELPVAPFCTEFDKNGVTTAIIRRKPWLDMRNESEFAVENIDPAHNAGCKPIYCPSKDSFVCYDSVYSISGRSLKIQGSGNKFGAYVLSKPGATLDLENYSSLSMATYNSAQNDVKLVLYYKEENGTAITYSINGAVTEELSYGWQRRTFDLTSIPKGYIEKMEFAFNHTAGIIPFVNIDDLDLVPKN